MSAMLSEWRLSIYLPQEFPAQTNASIRKCADEPTIKGSPFLVTMGIQFCHTFYHVV